MILGAWLLRLITTNLSEVCQTMDKLDCPYEHLEPQDIPKILKGSVVNRFEPAKTIQEDGFGLPTGKSVNGAVFFPRGGYVGDPKLSAVNAEAAEACGAEFRFNSEVSEISQENGEVTGVVLATGEKIKSNVVINIAGPHSFKINEMAGVAENMNISTTFDTKWLMFQHLKT